MVQNTCTQNSQGVCLCAVSLCFILKNRQVLHVHLVMINIPVQKSRSHRNYDRILAKFCSENLLCLFDFTLRVSIEHWTHILAGSQACSCGRVSIRRCLWESLLWKCTSLDTLRHFSVCWAWGQGQNNSKIKVNKAQIYLYPNIHMKVKRTHVNF